MALYKASAAVSDQIMAERCFVDLGAGQAVHPVILRLYDPPLSTQQSYMPNTAVNMVPFS